MKFYKYYSECFVASNQTIWSSLNRPSENAGTVKFGSLKAIVVSSFKKPWLVNGGVPGKGIEGEPGVVGELFKESVDCGQHLQSVPCQSRLLRSG